MIRLGKFDASAPQNSGLHGFGNDKTFLNVSITGHAFTDDTLLRIGDDVLFGGRGADVFVYDTTDGGADAVLDFTPGVDRIELGTNPDFDTLAEVTAAGTQDGNDAVFDFGDGNTLRLSNVSLASLTEDDFGLESAASAEVPAAKQDAIPVAEVQAELDIIDATAMLDGMFWTLVDEALL